MAKVNPQQIPANIANSYQDKWEQWPVSGGKQSHSTKLYDYPLSSSFVKLSAFQQTQGEVCYTQDTEIPSTGLYGTLLIASKVACNFYYINPENKERIERQDLINILSTKFSQFKTIITAADRPGNGCNETPFAYEAPLIAEDKILYVGQPLGLVLATTQESAEQISTYIDKHCLQYVDIDSVLPVLDIYEAIKTNTILPDNPYSNESISHIWKVIRPSSQMDWANEKKADSLKAGNLTYDNIKVDHKDCISIDHTLYFPNHAHFYMETQSCVAIWDVHKLTLYASTQSPLLCQQMVSRLLNIPQNQIEIIVKQVGGGYGGKTLQSVLVTCITALASYCLKTSIKTVLPREKDMQVIGKSHPVLSRIQLAMTSSNCSRKTKKGTILGVDMEYYGDAGATYDCSFVVSDCMLLRGDTSYYVSNYRATSDMYRTNTASNTAFRGFGIIQALLGYELAIDLAAEKLNLDSEQVRKQNLYKTGQLTPQGQKLEYAYIEEVWEYTKEKSDYASRLQRIQAFNQENKWKKRGLSIIPVKYGSGYNLAPLEQATALILVYNPDGTILIRHGGVDLGQGMLTKVTQIASAVLNIPIENFQSDFVNTHVIPNPPSTGASTCTQFNGEVVRQACEHLRNKIQQFVDDLRKKYGEEWSKRQGIDYWNYPNGWAHISLTNNTLIWRNIIALAWNARISLTSLAHGAFKGGETDIKNIIFKPYQSEISTAPYLSSIPNKNTPSETVDNFIGYTYNAACTEVEVDILTGETKIIRADIVYDMGRSLNPSIDIGQVEGSFVQEDNKQIQTLLDSVLTKWGYSVDIAANGQEAAKLASQKNYDMCLMDLEMPVMNGITATQNIRKQVDYFPIVLFSAKSNIDIYQLKLYGVDDVLSKPCDLPVLQTVLEDMTLKIQLIDQEAETIKPIQRMPMNAEELNELRNLKQQGLTKLKLVGTDHAFIVHKNIQNKISHDLIGEGKELSEFIDRSPQEPGRCHLYKTNLHVTKDLFLPEELATAIAEEDTIAMNFTNAADKGRAE
ncbi:xanthine dehydrogenase-like [Ylistrum balloti]|uniref:xanthine dehydrogenase-like n=1 Tax=Ylistrum balloti TaxID=509963 RepID=UPI002905A477|nr:xanthine dehydrogenase-like [Ylistrum balloti]